MNRKIEIKDYFENPELLDSHLGFHLKKENIIFEESAKNLIKAHLEKAKHNLRTADLLIANKDYNDWVVISLYYSLHLS